MPEATPSTEPVPGFDPGQIVPFVDADADEAGRVHVVWRALKGNATYVLVLAEGLLAHTSADGGATWTTAPHLPGYLAYDGVVARLDGDTLGIAMAGWQTPLGRVPGAERRPARRGICDVGYGWAPPSFYPGRSSRQTIEAIAVGSLDGGASWSAPREIGVVERLRPDRGVMLVGGRALRLSVVPRPSGRTDLVLALSQMTQGEAGMRLARSADGGATWNALTLLALDSDDRVLGTDHEAADVVPRGDRLGLFLCTSGRAVAATGACGGSTPALWHEQAHAWRIPRMRHRPARALALPDGRTVVAWTDDRRARRTWWADTRLAILARWSGVWVQRDLFAATWHPSGEATPPRAVTPRGAQVWNASRLFAVGERVGVVWQGATTGQRHGWHPRRLFLSSLTPA